MAYVEANYMVPGRGRFGSWRRPGWLECDFCGRKGTPAKPLRTHSRDEYGPLHICLACDAEF